MPQVEATEKDAALEDKKEAAEEESAAAPSPDEQPSTLKKAQDAAAARKDGEEVGDSGQQDSWFNSRCAKPAVLSCCASFSQHAAAKGVIFVIVGT